MDRDECIKIVREKLEKMEQSEAERQKEMQALTREQEKLNACLEQIIDKKEPKTHAEIERRQDKLREEIKKLDEKKANLPLDMKIDGWKVRCTLERNGGQHYASYFANRSIKGKPKIIRLGTRFDLAAFEAKISKHNK